MALNSTTKVGLTFGQIIAIIALTGGLITAYTDVNVKIANNEARIIRLETDRTENREDHKEMIKKLDFVITKIHNQK